MAYHINHNCPVCGSGLRVTRLRCPSCNTVIEGDFQTERLLSLNAQQRSFVLSFLRNRGNIREMEKELGISYPTVRSRLDDIIQAIDGASATKTPPLTRKQILEMLAKGELTQEDAMAMIQGGQGQGQS